MNPQALLGNLAWPADQLLLTGGVIVLAGIVLVNFWKEILVGLVALGLMAHYFSVQEEMTDKHARELMHQETIVSQPMQVTKSETSEYLEDCLSLTQNHALCAEIWAQLSRSGLIAISFNN